MGGCCNQTGAMSPKCLGGHCCQIDAIDASCVGGDCIREGTCPDTKDCVVPDLVVKEDRFLRA